MFCDRFPFAPMYFQCALESFQVTSWETNFFIWFSSVTWNSVTSCARIGEWRSSRSWRLGDGQIPNGWLSESWRCHTALGAECPAVDFRTPFTPNTRKWNTTKILTQPNRPSFREPQGMGGCYLAQCYLAHCHLSCIMYTNHTKHRNPQQTWLSRIHAWMDWLMDRWVNHHR